MEAFGKRDAIVRTRRAWLRVPAILALAPAVPILTLWHAHPGALAYGIIAAATSIVCMAGASAGWRKRRGIVRADATGLSLNGAYIAKRSSVRLAEIRQPGKSTVVHFDFAWRDPVEVVVEDELQGRTLLEAMRLEFASTMARYLMLFGRRRRIMFLIGFPVAMLIAELAALFFLPLSDLAPRYISWALPLFCAIYLPFFLRSPVALSVGADGIRLHRLFARQRFFPFRTIASAETADGVNFSLRLHDGETIYLTASDVLERGLRDEGRPFVARVTEQIASHQDRAPASASLLGRAGRSTEKWVRDLRTANEAQASYRVSALPRDELWRMVEDPSAPSTSRAGAAVALREGIDAIDRSRLSATAEACAAPRLRVALDAAAAEANEGALVAILDSLDDEEGPRHAGARVA